MLDPKKFTEIDEEYAKAFAQKVEASPYAQLLGTVYEEMRLDYARLRLPFRSQLNQSAGAVNGGAIASLIDAAGVGATASDSALPMRQVVTLDMTIQYLSAAIEEDLIAEAVVRRRGRKTINVSVDIEGVISKNAIAHGELVFMVRDCLSSTLRHFESSLGRVGR